MGLLFQIQLILLCILNGRFNHWRVLHAQAILESDQGRSTLYKKDRNAYGMSYVGNRFQSYRSKDFPQFAGYRSVMDSIRDRIDWDSRLKKDTSLSDSQYILSIAETYAPNQDYAFTLWGVTRQDRSSLRMVQMPLLVLVVIVVALIVRRYK